MNYLTLLQNLNFTKLWSSQILSQIAQNLLNFALIIRVFELAEGTRAANFSVALLVLAFGVPSVIFAAIAGVYVDYWDRRKVLIYSNIIRSLLVLGFLFFEQNLLLVLVLSFAIASTTQFFAPAEAASLKQLVGPDKLIAANSLFVLTFFGSFIVGYSMSAPVINLFGVQGPYYLTAAMFFIAALSAMFLPKLPSAQKVKASVIKITAQAKQEVAASWRIILSNHHLYFSIIQLTITQALLSIILALAPALSLALLHIHLKEASHLLVVPAGIGMLLGVFLAGLLARRFSKILIISFGLVIGGVALSLLGLTGQLHRTYDGEPLAAIAVIAVIVAGLMGILGMMNSLISVVAQTILQEQASDEMRGKIFSALYMMINAAATLPVLVAGVLADLTSVTIVVSALGAGLVVFAISQLMYLFKNKARLEEYGVSA